jgi:predicted metal-binding membrane protein
MMELEPQNAAMPAADDTDVPAAPAVAARATPAATAAALTGTLGLAAACWVIAVWQMNGMDMGTATQLGSFGFFIAVWVAMMAAMMLPGAAPAVLRRARAGGARARTSHRWAWCPDRHHALPGSWAQPAHVTTRRKKADDDQSQDRDT